MLAMLRGSEPRGLPGTVFDRVELQRAPEGHPLDDIVVHAHDKHGARAVLEVQVKRAISFSPQDETFREVVGQIAIAMRKPEFLTGRYEFAIATAQSTRAITGAYQEVLNWARKVDSATVFMARIGREKSANDAMRSFVATLRSNLQAVGAPHDESATWELLRRLQIHVYDFTAPASGCEDYARDRAADVLHPEARVNAGALWSAVVTHTLELSAAGGDATRQGLIDKLAKDFRFAGDRRYPVIRGAIAEASEQALADIGDAVHGASLGRLSQMSSVRAAADAGRFVEIRGDAGVGKSGLLKHLAEEVSREAQIVVLAPGRVSKRGWTAMRGEIHFDGSARELLSDLASDGGCWLFIDNLDFFDAEERTTVIDLVRAAAVVRGVTVIATARRRFGLDEPSWLPADAIARLGRADAVEVGQLSDEEIDELREAEPRLRSLLAKDHPARDVTRNLFRLARLMATPEGEPAPRSEVDMSSLWWRTGGGGKADATLRARGRALRDLAARSIRGERFFDVTALDDAAIDALISNESLRDFANDRVAFGHDVLREWAIANALEAAPELVAELPVKLSASPTLARSVELAARFPLENGGDLKAWHRFLDAVSVPGAHPSWRRSILLAPVHSEVAGELVPLIADTLLANDAALLRELIPIVMAVDVQPARELVAAGVPASIIPDGLNVPSNGSWYHLVKLLLDLGDRLPYAALPEAVDLLTGWCNTSLLVGTVPLLATILSKFETWLREIDQSNDDENWRSHRAVFGGTVTGPKLKRLEDDLRTYVALLASRAPDLAKGYLRSVQTRKRKSDIYEKLLKFRGTLAQAAPDELAAITLELLIRPESEQNDPVRHSRSSLYGDDALTHADKRFMPASPAQGPFFDLLTSAPKVGLRLIRALIDKTIAHHAKGAAPEGGSVLTVQLPEGPRRFLWLNTYGWSRTSHYYTITSALMALETWAHARIESGESVEAVLADVIGEPETPAAYLLVVVDILLSQWPASRVAAVPYVACPELLSLDLTRPVQERLAFANAFGRSKEPSGPKLEALKNRVSRRASLDQLLSLYATGEDWGEQRERAVTLLGQSVEGLGAPKPGDNLSEPRLMAFHALNLLDPNNYVDFTAENSEGEPVTGKQYVAPEAEAKHFEPLQKDAVLRNTDLTATTDVNLLIDDPERSSPGSAEALVKWAQSDRPEEPDDDEKKEVFDQAIVGAAVIAMRDGTAELRARSAEWAETVFAKVMEAKPDGVARMRHGMRFNPVAMAFAGRVFALKDGAPTRLSVKRLLDAAVADASAAHGASAAVLTLRALDARLPRAILRVGLAGSIVLWQSYDMLESEKQAARTAHHKAREAAVDAELAWLFDGASEPNWPEFPIDQVRVRERRVIGPPRKLAASRDRDDHKSKHLVDHKAAALWLSSIWSRSVDERAWLRDFERAYASWTYAANGAGLAEDEEVTETPSEWNEAFFAVAADGLVGQAAETIDTTIAPVLQLPDRQFFDVLPVFLRAIDAVFFNDGGIDPPSANTARTAFAERLARTRGWQRLRGTGSDRVEMHLGPAAATLFFNDYGFGQAPRCYLFEKAVEPSLVFLPLLERMAVSTPCLFVALLVLNWVETSPKLQQMPLVLAFATASVEAYSADRVFWIDHGIGRRICQWLDGLRQAHGSAFSSDVNARSAIDRILAKLVAIGVVDARRLELALQQQSR